jgi:hypothetical protein
MSSAEEWAEYKLSQLKSLEGLPFQPRRYEAPTEEWDHDHCVGCWATFSELDRPDFLHEGYFTSVPDTESPEPKFDGMRCIPEPTASGFAYRWVCRECFNEFRDVLGFRA